MNLRFLQLPSDERRLYIEQGALRRNVSSVILEKDFWVCWLLGVLFGSEFASSLVFKGGTSLSKVFGVIDRFSEDIDLSLSPQFLGLPEAGSSRNQANKWMKNAEAACAAAAQEQIRPSLEAAVEAVLVHGQATFVPSRKRKRREDRRLRFRLGKEVLCPYTREAGRWGVVRVPHGPRHELAGTPVPLPHDPAARV